MADRKAGIPPPGRGGVSPDVPIGGTPADAKFEGAPWNKKDRKPPGEEEEEEDDGFEVLTPLAKRPRDDNDDKDGTGGDGAASMFKVPTVFGPRGASKKGAIFWFQRFLPPLQ